MSKLSLSTMWSKDRYKHMEEFVREARRFGYSHIELNPSLTPHGLQELLETGGMNCSSVHSPCPGILLADGSPNTDLSLSALNREIRIKAVEQAISTIALASRVQAKAVVLHAGLVELETPWVEKLRRLYDLGLGSSKEFIEIKKQLVEERATKADAHFQAAKESIGMLLDTASEKSVMLGLENRVHYHEIPSLEEMERFLSDFAGKPIGYWHDCGHAEVQAHLGFESHKEWFSRLGSKIFGVHLHDVRGIQDHLAPGVGNLNWEFLAGNIPKDAIKVCEIGEWNREDDFRKAVSFLKNKGIT